MIYLAITASVVSVYAGLGAATKPWYQTLAIVGVAIVLAGLADYKRAQQ